MEAISQKIHAAQTAHGLAPEKVIFSQNSIGQVLREQKLKFGQKPFLIFYDEANNRSEYSYTKFVELVRKSAAFMVEIGLKRGDRIATAAHNHPDTIIQYFSAWSLGICVVPLNMSEDDARLRYIVDNSGAKVLFCREEYLERTQDFLSIPAPKVIPVFNNPHTPNGFHDYIRHQTPLPLDNADHLDDESLIVYTSGTTGNPKGVVLVQRNLFADGVHIAKWHHIDASQTMMCILPVHHVNGTIVTHVTPMLAGATVVLNRKFQTEHFFKRIKLEKVNIVSVVPTILSFLLLAKADSLNVSRTSLRHIICGAGPLTVELAKQFEEHYRIPVMHGYGLSETTCYSCFLPLDLSAEEHRHWMQDFGFPSIGIPLPCNEMAIHDEKGQPLPEMARGEIVIRGSNVMKEYYANEKANAEAFAFEWFRSGDEGFFKNDEKGRPFFFITGRIKELIIRGGINLAPLEIDEILAQAPGVKAGICVGFENSMYGEEVGALVVPQSDNVSKEEILAFCKEQLPFHKAPKVVVFTDELPVTTTGKYQRNKVKHLFADWRNAQFRKS